jgi:hypothetical protein
MTYLHLIKKVTIIILAIIRAIPEKSWHAKNPPFDAAGGASGSGVEGNGLGDEE